MIRFYFLPRVAYEGRHRPKYLAHPKDNPAGLDVSYRGNCDHASMEWGVTVFDATEEQHAFLTKQDDAFCFPEKAGDTLSKDDITLLQGLLDQAKIPGDWLTDRLTCEQIVQRICAMLARTWELLGILSHDRAKVTALTLDARFDSLPVDVRGSIMVAKQAETANDAKFGDVLKDLGATWDKPIVIGSVLLKVPDGSTSIR